MLGLRQAQPKDLLSDGSVNVSINAYAWIVLTESRSHLGLRHIWESVIRPLVDRLSQLQLLQLARTISSQFALFFLLDLTMAGKAATTTKSEEPKARQPSKQNPPAGGQHKSLCSLLRYFVGVELITIELKNGRIYQGRLSTADEYMNLTLDDATTVVQFMTGRNHAATNSEQHHESSPSSTTRGPLLTSVHIRGPTIRYIHFPDDLDLTAVIRVGMDRERSASQKYRRGKRSVRSSTTGAR